MFFYIDKYLQEFYHTLLAIHGLENIEKTKSDLSCKISQLNVDATFSGTTLSKDIA